MSLRGRAGDASKKGLTAMDKAGEGLMRAGNALTQIRHAADVLNGIAGAIATQGYALVEKEGERFVDQVERGADQFERAVDLAEAVAQHHGWVEIPETETETDAAE